MNIYTLYDDKAQSYLEPFFAENDELAERAMMQCILADTPMAKFPGDFTLYMIGTYDKRTGVIKGGSERIIINLLPLAATVKRIEKNQMTLPLEEGETH